MSEFIEVISKQSLDQLDQLIKKLNIATGEVKEFNSISKQIKVPSEANEQIKKTTKSTQKLSEAQKEAQRLSKALERQKQKLAQATSKTNRELIKNRFETQQINKEQKQQAVISSRLSTEYQKQQARVSLLSKRYQDLAVKQELGIRLSKSEERELKDVTRQIQRKQQALKKVDANMGVFNRNVGNYKSALGGLVGVTRGMVSALGLMGGAFLAVSIFRDGFKRIREFDKSMQNLAGITGKTRKELKSLEDRIISVAGSSVKTSNEVADLAQKLISLGKSEQEVKQLLPTVNDLGIALETTGDQAGELLISVLNAFGESTDSAEEFADIIAKTRTSTALDFERIKDALGFLAPTARAVGLSFTRTNAILGVLVDNGIKAARAGRLMNTAFNRITKEGLTLDEALEKINQSQDKLVTSSNLLGVEASTLGLILANNTDKVDEYDKAFQDAAGTLDGLVAEQMKSLDAKLAELDSAYEKLILNIENGNGAISAFFKFWIEGITNALNGLALLNQSQADLDNESYNRTLKQQLEYYKGIEDSFKGINKEMGKNERLIAAADDLTKVREKENTLLKERADILRRQQPYLEIEDPQARPFAVDLKNVNRQIAIIQARRNAALQALGMIETDFFDDPVIEEKAKEQGRAIAKAIKEGVENENLDVVLSDLALGDIDLSGLEEYQNMLKRTTELMKQLADESKKAFQKDLIIGELSGLLSMVNMDVNVLASSFETLADKSSTAFEKQIALADGVGEVVNGIGQTIFQNEQIRLQNQLALNSEYYNNLIQQASGNAEQQELLRREQAQKERQIRQKQAENDKRAAIFEIAINTAAAIVKALPNIPLSIAIGAIGAAKLALVSSRPVPQFKKGRKGGPETWAILGDGYKNEPIIDKKGNLKAISPNKPTMMHLDKDDSVLPNMDLLSDQIMLANVQASASRMTKDNQNKGLERMLAMQSGNIEKGVMKALKKAKFVNVNNTSVDLGYQFKVNRYKGK